MGFYKPSSSTVIDVRTVLFLLSRIDQTTGFGRILVEIRPYTPRVELVHIGKLFEIEYLETLEHIFTRSRRKGSPRSVPATALYSTITLSGAVYSGIRWVPPHLGIQSIVSFLTSAWDVPHGHADQIQRPVLRADIDGHARHLRNVKQSEHVGVELRHRIAGRVIVNGASLQEPGIVYVEIDLSASENIAQAEATKAEFSLGGEVTSNPRILAPFPPEPPGFRRGERWVLCGIHNLTRMVTVSDHQLPSNKFELELNIPRDGDHPEGLDECLDLGLRVFL
ncbi:hypothetical protein DFH08DRAFT_813015 [Mycena albidolilacea]|uniref:Uncharacterized protein n=1 Tax=Mycena albidolilacea TaxID=1033008 RepID=A0AAD7ELV6_9AGAR|nr:hypothetical protein DFH08DRAFT_813015 [Mycena albidolilacea]